jgi:hypothetical protein
VGDHNDFGTTFTVSSDVAAATTLSTSNSAVLAGNQFIQGADYVVFSNLLVGAGGTINITWTANTSVTSLDYGGPNTIGVFNGLQLAAVPSPTPGSRPIEIASLLTGNGTISYDSGATNYTGDLDIAGTANTFSGPWIVQQGTLLGSGANSLGTNAITVGAGGMLETAYNVNDTGAGLILNSQMFLHQNDTFRSLTVNGVNFPPGTYSFNQLNRFYPAYFPATWPLQAGSSVHTGSGSLVVLTGPAPPPAKPAKFVELTLVGGNLTLSGTNGAASGTYHLLTTTNLAVAVTNWTVLTNGSFDGSGNFSVTVPVNDGDHQQFYSIESP